MRQISGEKRERKGSRAFFKHLSGSEKKEARQTQETRPKKPGMGEGRRGSPIAPETGFKKEQKIICNLYGDNERVALHYQTSSVSHKQRESKKDNGGDAFSAEGSSREVFFPSQQSELRKF